MAAKQQGRILGFSAGKSGAATAILLAYSVGAIWLTPAHAQTAAPQTALLQQPNLRLSGHVGYSRISGPQAGVKLLDDIFMRVRSAPQVAMAKNNLNNLKHQSREISPGKTDYTLAIRPRQMGKSWQLPAPSLHLLPADSGDVAVAIAAKADSGGGSGGFNGAPRGEAQMVLGNKKLPLMANNTSQRGVSGLWEVGSSTALSTNSPAEGTQVSAASAEPSARFDSSKNEVTREYSQDSSNRQQPKPTALEKQVPDLSTALGRLAGVTRSLNMAQKLALTPASAPASLAGARATEETKYQTSDKKARLADADGFQMQPNAPVPARTTATGESRSKVKKSSVSSRAKEQERYSGSLDDERNATISSQLAKDSRSRIAMGADIALLPPNVVTGIPLVRLGISQNQAHSALSTMGSMRQDKVSKWTVWSWQRPQDRQPTALQLYIRNNTGLLDAMRIFDRSLIAPDFGVSLGDSLARVKEKFGEPAFILPEPAPGGGQNYIYPISQVGFQLSRPAPDEQPRVVSILIFNVK